VITKSAIQNQKITPDRRRKQETGLFNLILFLGEIPIRGLEANMHN